MHNSSTIRKVFAAFFLGFLIVLLVSVTKFFSSEKQPSESSLPTDQNLDIAETSSVESLLPLVTADIAKTQTHTLFIDIRSREDFDFDHIKDSVHIEDFDPIDYPTIQKVILVHTGLSGEQFNERLPNLVNSFSEQFVTHVLDGGFRAWQNEGIPTIKKSDPQNPLDILKIRPVEPRDVDAVIRAGDDIFTIVDVRTHLNFKREHIPGAINVPLNSLEKDRRKIPSRGTTYIYGSDNIQGFEAATLLHQLGRSDTYTINGGFSAWKEFGYPIEQSSE